MTTIAISIDYLTKLAKLKQECDATDGKMNTLKNIIVFDSNITAEDRALCEKVGLSVYTQDQVYKAGKEAAQMKDKNATINEPKPETCSAFSYTSGTTGDPKGVKLSHKMLV
jgi:long-subunit acyl-CoA synthetase (AMP-forming)